LYLAGLWKSDNGSSRFVILTQEAAGEQRRIHTRMPLVLDAAAAHDWCRGAALASILPFSSPQLLIREAQNKEPL
jgi:putative SOS response-associated peptidase YedK